MDGDQIRAWRAATPHEGRGAVSHTASIRGVGTPIIRGKAFKRGMNTKDKGTVLGLTNQGGGKQTSPLSDRKPSPCLRLPLRGRKVSVRSKGGRTQFAPTEITNPIGKLDLTTTIHYSLFTLHSNKKAPREGSFLWSLLHLSTHNKIRLRI